MGEDNRDYQWFASRESEARRKYGLDSVEHKLARLATDRYAEATIARGDQHQDKAETPD